MDFLKFLILMNKPRMEQRILCRELSTALASFRPTKVASLLPLARALFLLSPNPIPATGSENITDTAGKVLGVKYGGKIATGTAPIGTMASALAKVSPGLVGIGAPPPRVPGKGLPGGT